MEISRGKTETPQIESRDIAREPAPFPHTLAYVRTLEVTRPQISLGAEG